MSGYAANKEEIIIKCQKLNEDIASKINLPYNAFFVNFIVDLMKIYMFL